MRDPFGCHLVLGFVVLFIVSFILINDPDEDFVKTKMPQILDLVADKIKQGTLGSYTSNSTEMISNYSKSRHDYTTIVG